MASPVVAGAVALLASALPEATRWSTLNPGSMKQALVEGAQRLPGLHAYEQVVGWLVPAVGRAVGWAGLVCMGS